MVYVEPLGTRRAPATALAPRGYTRERYTRGLLGLVDALALPQVFLLGHSHGGFVAQYMPLHHPDRLHGLVLHESAPVTGAEHMAEAGARVQEFAARNEGRAELPSALAALQSVGNLTNDEKVTTALRALMPVYFARYWEREEEFHRLHAAVACDYIAAQRVLRPPGAVRRVLGRGAGVRAIGGGVS
ncbi:alpha/beta fold hydrolase, partial [Kitasatospora indigofera]|uniref:alpha/beta fold hydrolase n=1 Tax=Kitasatospora indigofera TaxID=67307 RepID=UPI00368C628B